LDNAVAVHRRAPAALSGGRGDRPTHRKSYRFVQPLVVDEETKNSDSALAHK